MFWSNQVEITRDDHYQNVMNLYAQEINDDARLLRQVPDKKLCVYEYFLHEVITLFMVTDI